MIVEPLPGQENHHQTSSSRPRSLPRTRRGRLSSNPCACRATAALANRNTAGVLGGLFRGLGHGCCDLKSSRCDLRWSGLCPGKTTTTRRALLANRTDPALCTRPSNSTNPWVASNRQPWRTETLVKLLGVALAVLANIGWLEFRLAVS